MSRPLRIPNVPVRTHHGETVRFYDDLIKDKVALIHFMFTACPARCPAAVANLRRVHAALAPHMGRDIFIVSVTVDPDRDTVQVLDRYSRLAGTGAGWTFVTGAPEDLARLQRGLGATAAKVEDHTAMVHYGNDATGSWAMMPAMQNPDVMAGSLLRVLRS